jgi:hypothetical protein
MTAITLPLFLHEATHSWCATSPVGNALAILNGRARQLAIAFLANPQSSSLKERLESALLRYDALTTVLRPVAEGLALASELDAKAPTMGARLYSAPMDWAATLAGHGIPEAIRSDFLNSKLTKSRWSDEFIRKRADLLASTFDVAEGGYLLGYMSVKALFRQLLFVHGNVITLDEMINLARFTIYSDVNVIHDALAEGPYTADLPTRMARSVADRLYGFFLDGKFPERIDRLRRLLDDRANDRCFDQVFHFSLSRDGSESQDEAGLARQLHLFNEGDDPRIDITPQLIRDAWEKLVIPDRFPEFSVDGVSLSVDLGLLLVRRSMFWLCSSTAVVVTQGGRVLAKLPNDTLLEAPAGQSSTEESKRATVTETSGHVDVLISISEGYRLDVISVRGEAVHVLANGPISGERKAALVSFVEGRPAAEARFAVAEQLLATAASKIASEADQQAEHRAMEEATFTTFQRLAMVSLAGVNTENFGRLARETGWYGVLGKSELVRGLALIIAGFADDYVSSMPDVLKEAGLDFEQVLTGIKERSNAAIGSSPVNMDSKLTCWL